MSARFSTKRGDHIEYALWLVFHADGGCRLNRAVPSVSPQERAVALSAKLPLSLFRTPTISATLTVRAPPVDPIHIDTEAAASALRTAIGCDVHIVVRDEATPAAGSD